MARIELDKGLNITAMHGTLRRNNDGTRLVVRTSSRTGRITMHLLKPQQRTTPVSDAEAAQRSTFALISREVTRRLRSGDPRPRSIIWAEVKTALSDSANV